MVMAGMGALLVRGQLPMNPTLQRPPRLSTSEGPVPAHPESDDKEEGEVGVDEELASLKPGEIILEDVTFDRESLGGKVAQ